MHHEESYQQMIDHFEEYTDVAGDHPLNLGSTTQVFNAFALTGDKKYYDHIVDYVGAWCVAATFCYGICQSSHTFCPSPDCSGLLACESDPRAACGRCWQGGAHRSKRWCDPFERRSRRDYRRRSRRQVVGWSVRLGLQLRGATDRRTRLAQRVWYPCGDGFRKCDPPYWRRGSLCERVARCP